MQQSLAMSGVRSVGESAGAEAGRLAGRILLDEGIPPDRLVVSVVPHDSNSRIYEPWIGEDGSFEVWGVPPGRARLAVGIRTDGHSRVGAPATHLVESTAAMGYQVRVLENVDVAASDAESALTVDLRGALFAVRVQALALADGIRLPVRLAGAETNPCAGEATRCGRLSVAGREMQHGRLAKVRSGEWRGLPRLFGRKIGSPLNGTLGNLVRRHCWGDSRHGQVRFGYLPPEVKGVRAVGVVCPDFVPCHHFEPKAAGVADIAKTERMNDEIIGRG